MKLNLTKDQLDKVKDMEFKREGMGALEFKLNVTDAEWEDREVLFRIERVSPQTYLRIAEKDGLTKSVPETLHNFISLPVEAKKIDFFTYDNEALNVVGSIISGFQSSPLLFGRGTGGLEEFIKD
ncbi:hypothetical protein [Cetobacterium sp.]|uniref:hypothetical protein n=1 Tax=Cetobacterium sp. TaxID=2071632 RepID=UPI003F34D4C0